MATNYYAVRSVPTTQEPLHIGKSSIGWRFLFHHYSDPLGEPPVIWKTYEQIMDWLYDHTEVKHDYLILDEYDKQVTFREFKDLVDIKQGTTENNNGFGSGSYAEIRNGYRFQRGYFR